MSLEEDVHSREKRSTQNACQLLLLGKSARLYYQEENKLQLFLSELSKNLSRYQKKTAEARTNTDVQVFDFRKPKDQDKFNNWIRDLSKTSPYPFSATNPEAEPIKDSLPITVFIQPHLINHNDWNRCRDHFSNLYLVSKYLPSLTLTSSHSSDSQKQNDAIPNDVKLLMDRVFIENQTGVGTI